MSWPLRRGCSRAQGYTGTALAAVLTPLHEDRKTLLRDIAHARRTSQPSGTTTHAVQELTTALAAGLHTATPRTWRNLITALSVEVRIDGYQPCGACAGAGYLPFPKDGSRRRWPTKCATCLRGTVPILTIEHDDITAATLAHDASRLDQRNAAQHPQHPDWSEPPGAQAPGPGSRQIRRNSS